MTQISGKVNKDGTSSSNHYNSVNTSTGVYKVTFPIPLNNLPKILVTTNTEGSGHDFYVVGASVKNVSKEGFTVMIANFNNPPNDSEFYFLVIE